MSDSRPPLPPFNVDTAALKVRLAEDGWNAQNPEKVSLAYTEDSVWRNRSEFIIGRHAIIKFLNTKWQKENEYLLIKELWVTSANRIAVRFAYEWHDNNNHGIAPTVMRTGNLQVKD